VKTKALVALLGATAILTVPLVVPDLAGSGSHAYAAMPVERATLCVS